jgi:hypothetical protein
MEKHGPRSGQLCNRDDFVQASKPNRLNNFARI